MPATVIRAEDEIAALGVGAGFVDWDGVHVSRSLLGPNSVATIRRRPVACTLRRSIASRKFENLSDIIWAT
jgi:hypothetical protein